MAGVLEYGTATAETLEALSAEPPPPPFEPGPASVVVWVDHASVWLPSSSTRRRALTTAPRCSPFLLRADLLVRGSPQEMIVEADAKQLGAHAVVVSDSGHFLTAQLADGLPFLEPTRLIAKVTSATPPEVVAEGSAASSADATAGSVGGGTDASYLLECPEPLRINLDPFHMRVCKEAAASLADAQAGAAAVAAAALAQRSGAAHANRSLRVVRRCGARAARCPARRSTGAATFA